MESSTLSSTFLLRLYLGLAWSWSYLTLILVFPLPPSFFNCVCVCVCAWPCPRSSFGRKGFKIYSFYKFIEKSNRFSFSIFTNKRYVLENQIGMYLIMLFLWEENLPILISFLFYDFKIKDKNIGEWFCS